MSYRLLSIETGKRIETLNQQYRTYEKILSNLSLEQLNKLNNNVRTKVPYIIYTEAAENYTTDAKVILEIRL